MRVDLPSSAGRLAALIVLVGASIGAVWAQDSRTVDVRFPRGSGGTTVSDSITGYESIDYRVGVSAGQNMSVQLDTDNASNYMNITAPGASEALFNGSISGNSTTFQIPSSGNYVVSVYLMRNAARRNETADFDLTLYVEAGSGAVTRPQPQQPAALSNGTPDRLSTSQMPRFCAGEASAEFGLRPQEIITNAAFQSGSNYVVQGYFDRDGDTTFFNCWFRLDGSFDRLN